MKNLSGILHGTFELAPSILLHVRIDCSFYWSGGIEEIYEISNIEDVEISFNDPDTKMMMHVATSEEFEEDLEKWKEWIMKQHGNTLDTAFAGCEVEDWIHTIII